MCLQKRVEEKMIFSLRFVEILAIVKFGALTHRRETPTMEKIVRTKARREMYTGEKRRGIHVSNFSGGG